jgi:small subunit ribosomal protein S8
MAVNDQIADLLTRIRNAARARHDTAAIPHSRMKEALARAIAAEGFLNGVEVIGEGLRKSIVVNLRYTTNGDPVFTSMKRTSKLGRRCYIGASHIRPSRQGMGVAILSTSKGIMKDVDAKRLGLGGEIICTIW